MARPIFEERWRNRFITRGRLCEGDAEIAGWSEAGLEARLRHFRKVWAGDAPGACWLDVGCGAGSYTRYLAERGVAAVGLDYSLPSVAKARLRGGAIPWLVGDATRLPLRPGALDGVLCFGVMQALAGPERVVTELVQAVRPGGSVWIDALNHNCLSAALQRMLARLRRRPLRLRFDRPEKLAALLEAAGGEAVRIHWVPILPRRLQILQPWVESRSMRGVLARLPWLGSLLSHAFVISARTRGGRA